MTIIIDVGDKVLPLLNQIVLTLNSLEAKMADISTDITNLVNAVTSITNDVAQVLALLKQQPNITADQQATLEAQIQALGNVDSQLKAAIPPAPTPTPPPTPGPTS